MWGRLAIGGRMPSGLCGGVVPDAMHRAGAVVLERLHRFRRREARLGRMPSGRRLAIGPTRYVKIGLRQQ
jgi:hypothetical protein